jgi:hypothetical protein
LQESGLDDIKTHARPVLVDASVQSNINFDETGLATDFSIDPVDHDDDGIPFASTRRPSPGRGDHIPATTLSAFSWRDRPRHSTADFCTTHHARAIRRHSSCQVTPGGPRTAPFILQQCLRVVPDAGGGSGVEVWDESFLLGAMGTRQPPPVRAPPSAARPPPPPSGAAAADTKAPVWLPPSLPRHPPHASRPAADAAQPRGRVSMEAAAAAWEWPSLIVSTVLPNNNGNPAGAGAGIGAASAGGPAGNPAGAGASGRAGQECRRLLL